MKNTPFITKTISFKVSKKIMENKAKEALALKMIAFEYAIRVEDIAIIEAHHTAYHLVIKFSII